MKRLVLVLAVAVLALLAFVLRSTTSRHDVASNSVATAESSDDARETSLATVETEAPRQANGTPTTATTASAPNELLIEVVDATTQAPVAGAQVFVEREDLDADERLEADDPFQNFGQRLAPLLSREFTSDDLGRVHVPTPTRKITIWSSLGHHHGEIEVEVGATSARVELIARRCVTVEVVDRAGRPVSDVVIGLFATMLGEWGVSGWVRTDAGGRVVLHSFDEFVGDETSPLRLSTMWVACTPEFREFTLSSLTDDVVRLVIEDTGAVELVATDARGAPIEMPVVLSMSLDERSPATLPVLGERFGQRSTPSGGGTVRFDHVGLGLALEAGGRADGAKFTKRFFAGPRTPDEVVRITVPVDEVLPAIRARLLDSEGTPLANRTYQLWSEDLASSDSRILHDGGRTNDHGRLREYLSGLRASNAKFGETHVDLGEHGARTLHGRAPWPAKSESDEGLRRDEYDLGDVVCSAEPLFCSGRVLDESGAPIADATIWYTPQRPDGSSFSGPQAHTDARGRFEIGVTADVAEIVIAAGGFGWQPTEIQVVTRGARDVVFRLARPSASGTLEGSWIVAASLTIDEKVLAFESERDGERSVRSWTSSAAHEFWTSLDVGVHTLIFSFDEEEVARVEGVEIKANETNQLAPIDLRSRIHALTFRVVDENGAPLRDGTVNVLRGGEFLRDAPLASDGRATLPSLTTIVDVVASAAGRRSRLFAGVENGATLELPRGIRANLRAPSLGDADLALVVELAYCGADPAAAYSDSFAVAFDGERASVEIPIAGDYCVVEAALVQRKSGARFELEAADVTLVTLVEAPAESTLSLPADALAAALRAATGR